MPIVNCDKLVTPSLVREVFQRDIVNSDNRGWSITVCGKLLAVGGKVFFETREQAVKAFYNSYRWRVTRSMSLANNPDEDHWWRDGNSSNYWKTFKKVLEKDYGFKFIKL